MMNHYLLPYGLEKSDECYGTVIATCRAGITIRLEVDTPEAPEGVTGFAFCHGRMGQRVLVSLRGFNQARGSFKVNVDSYLPGAEQQLFDNKQTA